MRKPIQYNDGQSILEGHVEILPSEDKDGTYVVTSYLEDEMFGLPFTNVHPDDLSTISKKQEKSVLSALMKMADGFKTKSVFDRMKEKGYDAL